MDTTPLAVFLFGPSLERRTRRACAAALGERGKELGILPGFSSSRKRRSRKTVSKAAPDEGSESPARESPKPERYRAGTYRLRAFLRTALRWVALVHAWYILTTACLLLVYRRVDPPITVLMAYRSAVDGWKLSPQRNVRLAKVPSLVRRMVVSVEDGKFYSHHGVDFDAIQYARQVNRQVGRPLYGGSTLSMQTARTLFLVPFKNYLRKYLELIATVEMELILPKERILEIYLSWAEWGKGVFGIEAAARKFYGKSLARLDLDQTARLVALLSSPIRYTPETLHKNGILRTRYQYLVGKYGAVDGEQ
ncbi:MAG: monofunctional biosynthetic peptidoglycan transglycosylase [Treponema sp.]|nr:monofunctional biosynthetic peptidoglycan transglycosylase [Treponema sp.]